MSNRVETCTCPIACNKTHPLCAIEQIKALQVKAQTYRDFLERAATGYYRASTTEDVLVDAQEILATEFAQANSASAE